MKTYKEDDMIKVQKQDEYFLNDLVQLASESEELKNEKYLPSLFLG